MVSGPFRRGVLVAAVAALRLSHLPRRPHCRRQANQPLSAKSVSKSSRPEPPPCRFSATSASFQRPLPDLPRSGDGFVGGPGLWSLGPVSHLCGGIMKHRTGLLAIPAFVVAAVALAAAPALAATTFTVSPGGAWSGTRAVDSTVGIRDAVSNHVTLCSGLAVAGSFKSGSGLSGTNIGALASIAFTGCQVPGVAL